MSIVRPFVRHIYRTEKTIGEAVMANYKIRSRKVSSVAGAVLALWGLAGMVGSLDPLPQRWSDFFCISLRVAMETLPAISLGTWQISERCILEHLVVLEGLFEVSLSWWHMVLTLSRLA